MELTLEQVVEENLKKEIEESNKRLEILAKMEAERQEMLAKVKFEMKTSLLSSPESGSSFVPEQPFLVSVREMTQNVSSDPTLLPSHDPSFGCSLELEGSVRV